MTTSRPDTSTPVGSRVLATSGLVAVAVVASTYALGSVIGPGGWTGTAVRTVAVLALVTGISRYALERGHAARGQTLAPPAALLPSLAGLVVGLWALLGLYGGPTDRFSLLIGLSNVDRVLSRLSTARDLTLAEVAPIDPSLPIALMAVGGAVVVFLVADLMAGGLRLSAGVALPLLALWIPGLVIMGEIPPLAFVVTVAALVLLLAVDNPHRTVRRGASARRADGRAAGGLRAVGALVVAVAVAVVALGLGTASASLPEVASASWSRLFSSTGQTVRLSDDLDMRRDLAERSGEVVLRYRTDSDEVGPLRVFTLTGFDGTNWRRGADRDGTPIEGADQVLWPTDPTGVEEPTSVRVTLESLRDTKLPVPTEPRAVDIDGDWSYDDVRDEVLGDQPTGAGTAYELAVFPRPLDAATLRGATGADPDDPNYLDVPATEHEQDIRDLATAVVDGAPTRYDQALALQTYFRDVSQFTYSTEVPPGDSGDAVWDFLQDRTGYCVQFATSMTMMARTLGIPARLGVGFLPGERVDDASFQVTGRDSHAWPELWFPGQGWVRFEPTPAQQTGPTPRWATPVAVTPGGPGDPGNVPTPGATTGAPTAPPSAAPTTPGTGGTIGGAQDDDAPWLLVVGVALLVALALGGALWLALRRRSETQSLRDAEDAWAELTDRLGALEVRWPTSTTPRRVPAAVVAALQARRGQHPRDEDVAEAVAELASALEAERYAPEPRTVARPDRLQELVDAAVDAAGESLSDRPARADGPSALPVG
ncbi:transglutaminaseTgpA domain-containing protein [Cellulosimicrobium cellulans]|uniref:transglutaminase family protein n=1 Tax=Cellulosimicrobium cellulans TaxID=1710 RepID=UPI0036E0AC7F